MDKKIFNIIYAKYNKKDYFFDKAVIKNKLLYARENNIEVKYSDIKNYFKRQKQKAYIMIEKRLTEYKEGKKYPQRERFTWEIIKALSL